MTPSSDSPSRSTPTIYPTFAWIRHSIHSFLAFGLGSGLSPIAPGTAGSLAAIPLFWLSGLWVFTVKAKCIILILVFIYGCYASEYTGKKLGESDHKGIVIDEIWAMWVLLCLFPGGLLSQLVVFGVFRLFDITKPYPIKRLEERFPNGFGVMIDDGLAAVYSTVVLTLLFKLAQFS